MIDLAPGLALLPAKLNTRQARVMLRAIQLQEDPQERRRQWPTGPARGAWQMEAGGGVKGVLTHRASQDMAAAVCRASSISPSIDAAWAALEHDDALACAFARLLIYTDATPLPEVGLVESAWQLYLRVWRPGAWARGDEAARRALRAKWNANYAKAMDEFSA